MIDLSRRGEVWWCEVAHIVRRLPSEVLLEPGDDPVPRPCAANLDTVESVATAALTERLGRLSDQRMREICVALEVATGCDP